MNNQVDNQKVIQAVERLKNSIELALEPRVDDIRLVCAAAEQGLKYKTELEAIRYQVGEALIFNL